MCVCVSMHTLRYNGSKIAKGQLNTKGSNCKILDRVKTLSFANRTVCCRLGALSSSILPHYGKICPKSEGKGPYNGLVSPLLCPSSTTAFTKAFLGFSQRPLCRGSYRHRQYLILAENDTKGTFWRVEMLATNISSLKWLNVCVCIVLCF